MPWLVDWTIAAGIRLDQLSMERYPANFEYQEKFEKHIKSISLSLDENPYRGTKVPGSPGFYYLTLDYKPPLYLIYRVTEVPPGVLVTGIARHKPRS